MDCHCQRYSSAVQHIHEQKREGKNVNEQVRKIYTHTHTQHSNSGNTTQQHVRQREHARGNQDTDLKHPFGGVDGRRRRVQRNTVDSVFPLRTFRD